MVQDLMSYILGHYHKTCMAVVCMCAKEAEVFV